MKLKYFILFIFHINSFAQQPSCGFKPDFEIMPNRNMRLAVSDNYTVYTIPILFEIYYRDEPIGVGHNISEQKIIDVLNLVNKRFAAEAPFSGINTNVRFELVKRNGNHEPLISGLKRINVYNYYEQIQTFTDIGEVHNDNYITIRTHDQFDNGIRGLGVTGGDMEMDYTLFNNIYDASAVIAHELGHVFSLKHTFHGSTLNIATNIWSCASEINDGISDTAPHRQSDSDCSNSNSINSCTGLPFGDILKNYMSYSNYSCLDRFSPLQVDRIRNFILANYNGFTNSQFLIEPTSAEYPKIPNCIINSPAYNGNAWPNGLEFIGIETDKGYKASSAHLWPGIFGPYKNYGRTKLITASPNSIIKITGTSWWDEKMKIYLDKNNDGSFNETTELMKYASYSSIIDDPNNYYLQLLFDFNFTLPSDALKNTYLRLRIVTITAEENSTACALDFDQDYGYGMVFDYALKIEDSSPVASITPPANISLNTNINCNASGVELGSPICNNCIITASINNAPQVFQIGQTAVLWTVITQSNGTFTATQIVTITDNILPTITAPANINLTSSGPVTNLALGSATTADNCSVASTTNNAPSSFPIGISTVTWAVTDGSSNTATANQIITITNCTAMATVKSGDWNDPTVWTCGRIPEATDPITINATHIITVPTGTFLVKNITYSGGIIQLGIGAIIQMNP